MEEPDVWRDQPLNKHFWAFYYFCKRKGDQVKAVKKGDRTADLWVWRNKYE